MKLVRPKNQLLPKKGKRNRGEERSTSDAKRMERRLLDGCCVHAKKPCNSVVGQNKGRRENGLDDLW